MYGKYNAAMHHGKESSKPGKALRMSNKANWTPSAGGQAAGTDSPGAARKRRTMRNRMPQGTGHAGKAGKHIKVPRVGRGGYYPLYGED